MYVNPVTSQFSVRTFVGICILLALLALFFVQNRVAVSTWWWNTTHTLPEVVLFVSQDTSLGLEMAAYYFDVGWMQEAYDINRAERLYDRIHSLDPTIAWVWYQKGRMAFLRGDYEQSLEYLTIYQAASTEVWPQGLYLRGVVQGFAGQPEAALETLLTYYEYDNASWYIYNNLAWTYFQLGQFDDMNTISAVGLELHPNNPWLLMNRSLALYNLGKVEQAKTFINQSYEQAVQLSQSDWSTTYPGNDPAIASMGLTEFLSVVEANRSLINMAE
jgi:tetratricopeptide (TPR) repeat protein